MNAARTTAKESHSISLIALVTLFLVSCWSAFAALPFPPPEFESGYAMPTTQNPVPHALWLEYFDVFMLAAALIVATWAVYKKRSRKWIIGLGIFSMFYFGFYREGCVCAIGSVQNVSLGLFNRSYAAPAVILAFFALPLVTALFFGRTFCAAACPHGALQDLILVKPIRVPTWLEQGLGVIPFVYLGLAALFAATGSAFIICQYDPFIPIFRLSGSTTALAIGGAFLVSGLFIGRPYCRFLCPYGALLKVASVFSRWRVRITPDTCTQCTLCAESCPFGVIREPTTAAGNTRAMAAARKHLKWALLLLPMLVAAGALAGNRFAPAAARVHPDVRLVEMPAAQSTQSGTLSTRDKVALTRAEQSREELLASAASVRHRTVIGATLFGAWVGFVFGWKLLAVAAGKRRPEFEPERSGCFACARCFESCPQERVRIGLKSIQEAAGRCALTAPAMASESAIEHGATVRNSAGAVRTPRPA